jgi:hypothetical protein
MGMLHREKGDSMIGEGKWSDDGLCWSDGVGSSCGDPLFWMNADPNAEFIPDPATKIEGIVPVAGLLVLVSLL